MSGDAVAVARRRSNCCSPSAPQIQFLSFFFFLIKNALKRNVNSKKKILYTKIVCAALGFEAKFFLGFLFLLLLSRDVPWDSTTSVCLGSLFVHFSTVLTVFFFINMHLLRAYNAIASRVSGRCRRRKGERERENKTNTYVQVFCNISFCNKILREFILNFV